MLTKRQLLSYINTLDTKVDRLERLLGVESGHSVIGLPYEATGLAGKIQDLESYLGIEYKKGITAPGYSKIKKSKI